MSGHAPPALSPEMLLFEVAAMCSRHALPVSTSNPQAALYHATGLLRALGLAEPPPAIEAAAPEPPPGPPTAVIPRLDLSIPRGPDNGRPPRGEVGGMPAPLPRRTQPQYERGQHRVGAERSLRVVEEVRGNGA